MKVATTDWCLYNRNVAVATGTGWTSLPRLRPQIHTELHACTAIAWLASLYFSNSLFSIDTCALKS